MTRCLYFCYSSELDLGSHCMLHDRSSYLASYAVRTILINGVIVKFSLYIPEKCQLFTLPTECRMCNCEFEAIEDSPSPTHPPSLPVWVATTATCTRPSKVTLLYSVPPSTPKLQYLVASYLAKPATACSCPLVCPAPIGHVANSQYNRTHAATQ